MDGRIGVFDSGFGGLTVLRSLLERLPHHDYLYLGDSARTPYGSRGFDVVHEFTREAVEALFDAGCPLVVVACNTASSRALRTLQQLHLPRYRPDRSVLGVVRPSVEALAGLPSGALPGVTPPSDAEGRVAILGTQGTVASDSYRIELAHLAPRLRLVQQACPLWVPLVEAGETEGAGPEWFLHRYLDPLFAPDVESPSRILLACTHYPVLMEGIRRIVPHDVALLSQGPIVAERLEDWLHRHPDMDRRLSRSASTEFWTTDDAGRFGDLGARLLGRPIDARKVRLSPWSPPT
jgi:glutamate racemase